MNTNQLYRLMKYVLIRASLNFINIIHDEPQRSLLAQNNKYKIIKIQQFGLVIISENRIYMVLCILFISLSYFLDVGQITISLSLRNWKTREEKYKKDIEKDEWSWK